jgi:hypothetical protein
MKLAKSQQIEMPAYLWQKNAKLILFYAESKCTIGSISTIGKK